MKVDVESLKQKFSQCDSDKSGDLDLEEYEKFCEQQNKSNKQATQKKR